jgi:hypothetical protein
MQLSLRRIGWLWYEVTSATLRTEYLAILATDEEPLESLPAVPAIRHQISGQRRPTPQAFTLSRSDRGNFQSFAPSGKTWPKACTYSYQMRSAAHRHI